jgi:hypothetical protein
MDHLTSVMQSIRDAGSSLMAAIEECDYDRAFNLAEERARLFLELEALPAPPPARDSPTPVSGIHRRQEVVDSGVTRERALPRHLL